MRTIYNPKKNKEVNVFFVETTHNEVIAILREGKSAKEISWMILNKTNVSGVKIFEGALDWSIGLCVVSFIKALSSLKKKASKIRVAFAKNGDVFILDSKDVVVYQN